MKKLLIISLLLTINFGCQNQSNSRNNKSPIIQLGSETVNCSSPKSDLQREICGDIRQQEVEQEAWDAVMNSMPPQY